MDTLRDAMFRIADHVSSLHILPHLRELRKTQYQSRSTLDRIRNDKVRKLIRHAYETVPYYRSMMDKHGISPERIRGIEDLAQLPILTKKIIRKESSHLISRVFQPSQLHRGETGGSTGSPLVYYFDQRARVSIRSHYYRGLEWMGWKPGDPIVSFWGRRLFPTWRNKMGGLGRRLFTNHREVDAHKLDNGNLRNCLQVLQRSRGVLLIGYANALAALANYLKRSHEDRASVKGILSTAEVLSDETRSLLEEVFRCRVFNSYGLSEVQSVSYQCDKGSIHVCEERVHVEVLPGGQTLVTDLDNYAMPFLRYNTGDTLELTVQPCDCGRTLSLIRHIRGRVCDIIEGLDGKRVHAEYFTHLLEANEIFSKYGVEQFQVTQESPDAIVVRLVASLPPEKSALNRVSDSIRSHLGNVRVRYDFPTRIQPSKSGKHRFVIPYQP